MEENKYKDVLSNMRKFRDALKNHEETDLWVLKDEIVTDIEYYFPELKESEEEKARKELVEWLKSKLANPSIGFNPAKMDKWIAYLEKAKDFDEQLEQAYKNSDEVQYKRGYEDGYVEGMAFAKQELEKQDEQEQLTHSQVTKKSDKVWSEEDEKILCGVIDEIQANKSSAPEYDLKTYDKFLSWLKSIKQRLQ